MEKVINWGILSTAKIALKAMISAISLSNNGKVFAIASRNLSNAQDVAKNFEIERAYGSYEELLLDKDIDAIYNPLPNNLHLEYTLKALEHGKHVLCEKPIGLNTKEAEMLNKALLKYPNLKVMEAFMYKFHPQWLAAKELIRSGKIGEIRGMQTLFSYHNIDEKNIRNQVDAGGGALMDIGCYCISFPRFILNEEPINVLGSMQIDKGFGTDFLTSGILNFSNQISATFLCTTQAFAHQRFDVFGSKGKLEIEIPCNAPVSGTCKITLTNGNGKKEMLFNANQYQLQAEAFANCIIANKPVPYQIDDAMNNMKVTDAIKESAKKDMVINLR